MATRAAGFWVAIGPDRMKSAYLDGIYGHFLTFRANNHENIRKSVKLRVIESYSHEISSVFVRNKHFYLLTSLPECLQPLITSEYVALVRDFDEMVWNKRKICPYNHNFPLYFSVSRGNFP